MRAHRARLGVLMAVGALSTLAVSAPARADTVTQWNSYGANALARVAGQGAIAVPHLAMVHGAMYDAVNAIDRRYEPYLCIPRAKRWYSQDAAAATAAYRVLVDGQLVAPAQQAALVDALTPLYTMSLAAIPDGPAKTGGIATGEAAAGAMVKARLNDGRFGAFRFSVGSPPGTPGYRPGVWRPTPPAEINDPGAWLKDVTPFLIDDPSRFRTEGPARLTSHRYAREFKEVKSVGALASTKRTADQTNAARHWGAENGIWVWSRILRTVAEQQHLSIADDARLFAMVYLTGADAGISTWEDKARWSFWRPITAIREADADRNKATVADPKWEPLIATPPYPDHPSGLVGLSGANVRTLQDFFGTDSIAFTDVTTPAPPLTSITHSYASFSQLLQETVNARVWSGIHFRTADEQAAQLGDEVARWREDHGFFRPACDRHDGDEDDHGHDDGDRAHREDRGTDDDRHGGHGD